MAKSKGWLLNLCAFIAVIAIGVALALSMIGMGGQISAWFRHIAEIFAYIVVAFYSFFFAFNQSGRNRLICIIIWVVAVVLIVIGFIVPLFKG